MPGTIYVSSGGQTGSILTIVSSGTGTITVSNTTLGKSYSKSVTAGGSAVFRGLQTGTWTVTLTDGTQTSTKTVIITSDYSTNIAYFSASINITYPANSTCVVTDSSGQTIASDTNAGTSAKTWTATVNAKGVYTVTATDSADPTKTKSQSVSIASDGQSVSVSLAYELHLFESGVGLAEGYSITGTGWTTATATADKITLSTRSGNYNGGSYILPAIDCSQYTTLAVTCVVTAILDMYSAGYIVLSKKSSDSATTDEVANVVFKSSGTYTLDLTNIEETLYLLVNCGRSISVDITDILFN